jgi:modulator of FtsH protease HflC
MKKSDLLAAAVFAVALVLFLILSGAFYTVDQTEQVIITQFGEPVGTPITEPGLHFKKLSENAQASLRTIRWIMAILIQASLVRGLIS